MKGGSLVMDAEALIIDAPDDELRAVMEELPRLSAASKSEARHDRACADGSVLVVTSRDGAGCEYEAVSPPEDAPSESPPE